MVCASCACVLVVTLPGASCKPGILSRLIAPTPESIFNVTLAGQTFDGSLDGKITGTLATETVAAHGCKYSFSMPAPSAALLLVPA